MTTNIYFLIDSSGSMEPRSDMVVSSINEFLEEQKSIKEECKVSFYTFSRVLNTIFENKDIHSVSFLKKEEFRPYGTTALWDSMAEVLKKIPTREEEGKNILIVVTDGEENSSLYYNPLRLKTELQRLENKLQVVYIGSNQDAVLNGKNIGSCMESSMNYKDDRLPQALRSTSDAVRRYRTNMTSNVVFTEEERRVSV